MSQINSKNRPAMINVGDKAITKRTARAQAIVELPREIARHIANNEIQSIKGPVFQTAILAGIMAAKRTGTLIPLCHPIPIEDCTVNIRLVRQKDVLIECSATTHGKTGVEMEALTGAAMAALTVYDMCKGLSHNIVIKNIFLLEKTGGKKDYKKQK